MWHSLPKFVSSSVNLGVYGNKRPSFLFPRHLLRPAAATSIFFPPPLPPLVVATAVRRPTPSAKPPVFDGVTFRP
jgi:hypothetical protein